MTRSFDNGKSNMVDNAQRTIAENKIKELEKEILVLERLLRSKESFNSAAWAEYGSELCAGEMVGNEQKIRLKISSAKGKVALLMNFIKGNVDISEEDYLQGEYRRHDQEIARLKGLQASIDVRLEAIKAVKRLLSI